MICRYAYLSQYPRVFLSMTGLRVKEFDTLVNEIAEMYGDAEEQRLSRPDRKRAIGGGHPFELSYRDQVLLTVVWLRVYPVHEILGYLFGVSGSTVSRTIWRVLPVLEQAGKDSMRMPDPGKKRRRDLDELLKDTPELAVIIDTFEQRVQRALDHDEADSYYSGKKRQNTLKSQVAVNEETGEVVHVPDSVKGPTADLTLLKQSGLLQCLPEGVGALGDLAYLGIDTLHRLGAAPRRKPRGKERPPEDILYNQTFSKRRIIVENTIGRMRRYRSLSQMDRNHRQLHSERTRAVAGLVNRQIRSRLLF
jgi:hypothetical protein